MQKKKQVRVRLCCSSSQHHLPAALAELGSSRLCKAKGFHVRHLETWHRGDAEPPSPARLPPGLRDGAGSCRDGAGWDAAGRSLRTA